MNYKIQEIEGIGPANADKLAAAGIDSTAALLRLCCTSKGRREVADKTGVTEAKLLKWANMADLMRISGIGAEFSELLEAAGVDTVKELRTRNVENLAGKMREVNSQKKLTRTVPSAKTVSKWVDQAAQLPPMISH
jgi:predicted flap endonuclease-1-like 5' DNA nuclease